MGCVIFNKLFTSPKLKFLKVKYGGGEWFPTITAVRTINEISSIASNTLLGKNSTIQQIVVIVIIIQRTTQTLTFSKIKAS